MIILFKKKNITDGLTVQILNSTKNKLDIIDQVFVASQFANHIWNFFSIFLGI